MEATLVSNCHLDGMMDCGRIGINPYNYLYEKKTENLFTILAMDPKNPDEFVIFKDNIIHGKM